MYEPTDQDVLHCLAAMKVDPEHAGANNAADRLLLLHKALQRVQSLGRVPLKAETDGSGKVVDPSAFPKISSRGKLVAKEFDGEKAYSMQVMRPRPDDILQLIGAEQLLQQQLGQCEIVSSVCQSQHSLS